jgi:hypothetical protein
MSTSGDMRPLPAGLQREYDAAVQRTGETAALILAQRRISLLLSLTPEQVQRVTEQRYRELV